MKVLISLCLAVFACGSISYATVRTVSNHPNGGAQYYYLNSAYDAAVAGDTLLLEGTDIAYDEIYVNKQLIIIGIGFNPQKTSPKRVKIGAFGSNFEVGPGGSGSKIYGIEFLVKVEVSGFTNGLTFEDCRFNERLEFTCIPAINVAIRNCIFDRDNDRNLLLCNVIWTGVISNCVFDGWIDGGDSGDATMTIEHCLFLNTVSTCFKFLHWAQIENNIFYNSFPGGTFNSNYENNLCRVAGTFPPSPANGNTGSNNIENTDPLLSNCPFATLYNTAQDYHLQTGSAAIGAANDDTDIGVHGGFTNFSEQGEVLINPIVRNLNVINSSVQPNGILQVNVHITKPDND